MKKLTLLIILLSIGFLANSQPAREKLMPVTTSSKSALPLYNEAMKYFDKVKLDKALETFKKALNQDPDFFMANYQLAFYYLLNGDPDKFRDYADAAVNCKAKLSNAEDLLKDVLVTLKQGRTNVTDMGRKLVDMYPDDPNSYNNLVYFQSLAGDSTGIVETLNKAIKVVPDPAPFYNQLGYAYLTLKQSDKAEEAFDKYIELDPKNPNVYDSKGDYFMYKKDYERAYQSYMKAYTMDPSFSHDKAETARQLYERTEGKKLEIISI
ncbi:MAG: tetratricopeptide repeat protein [Bacteroidota bacterium]|nr:tetratricopeptide repeat protein [Bacteroidota bacterium]